MTWVKLPDDALEDPQVADLEAAAVITYLRTLGWSNRWARDGAIPQSVAGEHATAWVDAGLATARPEGVQLVWRMEYQPTSDEIKERRQVDAERQARRRRHMADDHSACDPTRCRVLKSRRDSPVTPAVSPRPPTRPDPTPPDPKEERGRSEGAKTTTA